MRKADDRKAVKAAFNKIYAALYARSAFWCVVSGMIYSLSFFRGYLFVFGFIGLFLFYLKLFEGDHSAPAVNMPFRKTFFFSAGFFIPLYSWFFVLYPFEAFSFTKTQGMLIVIFADIGLGLLHAAMMSLCFLLLKIFPKNKYLLPVGAGFCMMLFEWISSLGPLAFPWGTAAVGQYMFLPLIQNVSLFGLFFIALIINLFAAALSLFVKYPAKKLLIYAVFALNIPIITGTVMLQIPHAEATAIKTATLQGNVLSMEKWNESRLDGIIERYEKLAEEAAENGAKLIVLPESAIPSDYDYAIYKRFADIAQQYNCTILMSALTRDGNIKYNSVFAIYPDGGESETYSKRHLVPFGEYLPFRKLLVEVLPFLEDLNLSSSPYTAGSSSVIMLEDGTTIGCLICFDSIFAPLAVDSAEKGAELMLVSTNDSWYEDSPAVYQHMAHSVLRAVETGKWLVRAANTGISCYISPDGFIYDQTEPLTETIAYHTVYTNSSRTLYSRIGDSIMLLPMLYILISLLYILKKKVKRHGKYTPS